MPPGWRLGVNYRRLGIIFRRLVINDWWLGVSCRRLVAHPCNPRHVLIGQAPTVWGLNEGFAKAVGLSCFRVEACTDWHSAVPPSPSQHPLRNAPEISVLRLTTPLPWGMGR